MILEIVARNKENHAEEIEYNKAQRESFNCIIARMDNWMEKIYEDKLDGIISFEDYHGKYQEYKQTKENALAGLEKLHKNRSLYYEAGFAIYELARQADKIYLSRKATMDDRRLLLSYIFRTTRLKTEY